MRPRREFRVTPPGVARRTAPARRRTVAGETVRPISGVSPRLTRWRSRPSRSSPGPRNPISKPAASRHFKILRAAFVEAAR